MAAKNGGREVTIDCLSSIDVNGLSGSLGVTIQRSHLFRDHINYLEITS